VKLVEKMRAGRAHAAVLGLSLLVSLTAPPSGSARPVRQAGVDELETGPSPKDTELLRVRHEARGGSTLIVLEGSGPLAYSYSSAGPRDAVLELPGVSAPKLPSVVEIGTPEVDSIRLSELNQANGGRGLRVEVRLPQAARHRVFPSENDLNLVFTRSRALPTGRDASTFDGESATTEPARVAVPPSAGEPAPPAPPVRASREQAAASNIVAVSVEPGKESIIVEVRADGRLSYEAFLADAPVRLVVDFAGVANRAEQSVLPVDYGAVARVRITQHSTQPELLTRLVVDLREYVSYEILERKAGLAIVLELGAE